LSVQACLAAIDEQLAPVAELGWAATDRAKAAILGSEDSAEGVASFLEKRPPQWRGR
jgi:enoyl-CoA hydratase/carnithine racemase